PERCPRAEIPVSCLDVVADIRIHLECIEIGRIATEVRGAEVGIRTLVDVIQAPVLAVDIEVIETAVTARMSHRELLIACKRILQKMTVSIAAERPRIVLCATQVEFIELVASGWIITKQRIVQLRRTVAIAEKETERML